MLHLAQGKTLDRRREVVSSTPSLRSDQAERHAERWRYSTAKKSAFARLAASPDEVHKNNQEYRDAYARCMQAHGHMG